MGVGDEGHPSSSRGSSPLPPPGGSVRALKGLGDAIHTGKGVLTYSVYQLNAHLFQKHPQSHRAMFYQLSGHPLASSS